MHVSHNILVKVKKRKESSCAIENYTNNKGSVG